MSPRAAWISSQHSSTTYSGRSPPYNATFAMLKRERATPQQVRKALEAYWKIPIRFVASNLGQSLNIAEKLNIYAYDAYLMRCALRYRSPLISLERHLILYAQTGV
jgi:predicted nucleic acid-binding protein